MKPDKIQFGVRYGDDSGWDRRVEADRHEFKLTIEHIDTITIDLAHIDWLHDVICQIHEWYHQDDEE